MVRHENWALLLSDYLKEKRLAPFQWGQNDCLCFVYGALSKITDVDIRGDFPEYSTEAEAEAILQANGGVIAIIERYLGLGNRHVLQAKRGDVVVVKAPEYTAGIVDDSGQWIDLVSKDGYVKYPLTKAWKFWSY